MPIAKRSITPKEAGMIVIENGVAVEAVTKQPIDMPFPLASIASVTRTNAPVCATAAGIARPADATAPNKDAATR